MLERDRAFNARVAAVQNLAQDYYSKHEWEMSRAMREQFFQDLIASVAQLKTTHVQQLNAALDALRARCGAETAQAVGACVCVFGCTCSF